MRLLSLILLCLIGGAVSADTIAVAGTSAVINKTAPTYTAESGSNRLLVLCLNGEDLTDNVYTPVFGGITMVASTTDSVQGVSGTNGAIFHILEANIPSGSQTLTMDEVGLSWSTNAWAGQIFTLTGVNQTTPVNPSAAESSASSATSHTTANVTSITDGILMAGFTAASPHSSGSSITTASWTDFADIDEGGGSWRCGFKLISSGTSENVTFDWDSTAEAGSMFILGFQPVVSTSIVIERRRREE